MYPFCLANVSKASNLDSGDDLRDTFSSKEYKILYASSLIKLSVSSLGVNAFSINDTIGYLTALR